MRRYHIFALGLDEENLETLGALSDADKYAFHQLLSIDELQGGEEIPFQQLLDKAVEQLEASEDEVDAVIGYWDFPVTSMVPILAERFGFRSASLQTVVKCEHKYWSRLEQRRAAPEVVPDFDFLDPDDPDPVRDVRLSYPFWLKPVKAFSSEMAYRIDDDEGLQQALAEIREGIGRIAEPFDNVLSRVDLPSEIAEIGASACIAEKAVSGKQVTVEGYRRAGDEQATVYAAIDSIPHPDVPSFERFQYPSTLPQPVRERAMDASDRIVRQVGLTDSLFNIEFFYDADADELKVLEVNPRHSQSHAELFTYVDGMPNHKLAIDIALGHEPELPYRKGSYAIAAKWFLRRFDDGVCTRAPTDEDIATVERQVPGTQIDPIVAEGDRLSKLPDQDAYSFKIANIYVGAADEEELRAKFDECAKQLPYEFEAR